MLHLDATVNGSRLDFGFNGTFLQKLLLDTGEGVHFMNATGYGKDESSEAEGQHKAAN